MWAAPATANPPTRVAASLAPLPNVPIRWHEDGSRSAGRAAGSGQFSQLRLLVSSDCLGSNLLVRVEGGNGSLRRKRVVRQLAPNSVLAGFVSKCRPITGNRDCRPPPAGAGAARRAGARRGRLALPVAIYEMRADRLQPDKRRADGAGSKSDLETRNRPVVSRVG